ncbi:MAG: hypothetical protein ACI8UO_001095 [Verrucomicrobiales bacterium]|jgi:hypothetical protein
MSQIQSEYYSDIQSDNGRDLESTDRSGTLFTPKWKFGFACAALTIGATTHARPSPFDLDCLSPTSFHNGHGIFGPNFRSAFEIDTGPRGITRDEAVQMTADYLALNGFEPDRSDETADGSTLFQFFGPVEICVDLYSNGDLIVVVDEQEKSSVHELRFEDLPRAVEILRENRACK